MDRGTFVFILCVGLLTAFFNHVDGHTKCPKPKACKRYPSATECKENCQECDERLFFARSDVTGQCDLVPKECPEDEPKQHCRPNPCHEKTCEKFPNAKCEQDKCGECRARFFNLYHGWYMHDVTDQCDFVPDTCPEGVPRTPCYLNPCDVETCGNYENVTCRAYYCGGCNARFFVVRDYANEGYHEVTDFCT